MGRSHYQFLALALLLFGSASVVGQTAPAPTREEVERKPVFAAPDTPKGRISIDGDVEAAPCPLADAAYADVKFDLVAVTFSGLPPELADAVAPSWVANKGKSLPVAAVCTIRDRAATILRARGYLAAVQVPAQRIENGKLVFTVLMAKIVGFQVRGDAGKSEAIIARYLKQIQNAPLFNINQAERYLLLARDLPGIDLRMTLRPAGTVPGEVIGEVMVTRTPVELEVNTQDYGSTAVGRFGGLATIHFNGFLGVGDRTTLGFYSTSDFDEQQVAQASEMLNIGSNGLTFAANFTYAWTHPKLGPNLTVRSRTVLANAELRYPFIRRQTHNLAAAFGFDYVNQSTTVAGTPLTNDHLREFYARVEGDVTDSESLASTTGYSAAEPRWRMTGNLSFRKGVDLFSASAPGDIFLTRFGGNPQSLVVRANGLLEVRPTPKLTLSMALRAQYAPDAILAFDQMAGGNFTVGRAYDPGSVTGDSGYGLTNEIRYGSLVPKSVRAVALQGYAFFDAAWVSNNATALKPLNPQTLYSAGGGVRAAWGEHMVLDAGLAVPLKTLPGQTRLNDVRFLINLTARLLPWSRR